MKSPRFRPPSPATLIAVIALVVALAGSAVALPGKGKVDKNDLAKGAVTKKALKKNAVTKKALKDGAVTNPKLAAGAVDATKIAPHEAPHVIGAPGEPAFSNGGEGDCVWSDVNEVPGFSGFNPVSFFKDQVGFVHLRGIALSADGPGGDGTCDPSDPGEEEDGVVFTMPNGYVPDGTAAALGGIGGVVVAPAGGASFFGDPIPGAAVFTESTAIMEGLEFLPAG
jgi:hypothetical protein